MTHGAPRIGLTVAYSATGPDYYLQALTLAGAEVRLLPRVRSSLVPRQLSEVDALCLPGGGDVHAMFYGEPLSPLALEVDLRRDEHEIALAREATGIGLPLLGICRGHQVLNVALGGSLCQDLAREWGAPTTAHRNERWAPDRFHAVDLTPGSRAAEAVGSCVATVNSHHHQAVARLAPGLTITATAEDGVVEAIEAPGRPTLGVQWHPERLDPTSHGPLRALVAWAHEGVLA